MLARERPIEGASRRARSLRRRMTFTEQALWKELRKLDANFRRQAPIGRYFADFACYARKLVIEVDGGVHERLEAVQLRDVEHQQWLESEGFKVVRYTDREVANDIHACIDQIKALLLEGGGLGGGGVAAELKDPREWAPAPNGARSIEASTTPPSPTLPPSRRKGARLLSDAHANGEVR